MTASDSHFDSDNLLQPFQLESSNLRGRAVRLGSVLDKILEPLAYPDIVAQLVAEAVSLAVMLSSMLKYQGVFTLQIQGEGPLRMLIANARSDGGLRACAGFDRDEIEELLRQQGGKNLSQDELLPQESGAAADRVDVRTLLGKGHMAFTVDQGRHEETYQGIVEISGPDLASCVRHYFAQSEQIGTAIQMYASKQEQGWRGGGIMLQHLPEDESNPMAGVANFREDDWRRAMILLGSCTAPELLSPEVLLPDLLFRLFHEEGVRVYEPLPLSKECRCSPGKLEKILMLMSGEDRDDMAEDGKIVMTCEFCNKDFSFDNREIDGRINNALDEQDLPDNTDTPAEREISDE